MRKVYSFDDNLFLATGAHRVLVDIHNAIKHDFESIVISNIEYDRVNPALGIKEDEFQKFKNPFILRGSILFVHQRRLAILFNILNHLLLLNARVVYVHHNVLSGNKLLTILPKHIITISDRCILNLTDYFRVPSTQITKIYNSVPDTYLEQHKLRDDAKIKILYPATVYHVKRQLEIVRHLKPYLPKNIEIIFAGGGEDLDELRLLTKDDVRFTCLGFVSNVKELLMSVDYCMLFSKYEGLPISLIEAAMMGVPIICNDVGGNLEIANEGYNAFVCNNWEELRDCMINLNNITKEEYIKLSMNSRKIYRENFTFDKFKLNYINFLSSLK